MISQATLLEDCSSPSPRFQRGCDERSSIHTHVRSKGQIRNVLLLHDTLLCAASCHSPLDIWLVARVILGLCIDVGHDAGRKEGGKGRKLGEEDEKCKARV